MWDSSWYSVWQGTTAGADSSVPSRCLESKEVICFLGNEKALLQAAGRQVRLRGKVGVWRTSRNPRARPRSPGRKAR